MKLLLAGGSMRPAGVADRDHEPLYREARLVELDTETGEMTLRLSWRSAGPWDPDRVGHCFKGASWDGGTLLLCTEREVLFVDRAFVVRRVVGHPWFNDLHGAARLGDRLHVVSTGLDAVLELEEDEVVAVHRLGRRVPDPTVDYRALSTKPHEIHPNHVFAVDGRRWVTRFHRADAVALGHPERRVPIGRPPHDGLVRHGQVWFTTVDGRLVRADARTLETHVLELPRAGEPLGWCRGLWIDDVAWIGFSRLRATTARHHLARLRGWLRGDRVATRLPTRVDSHDLSTGARLGSWPTEALGLHAIFAIVPLLAPATGSGGGSVPIGSV